MIQEVSHTGWYRITPCHTAYQFFLHKDISRAYTPSIPIARRSICNTSLLVDADDFAGVLLLISDTLWETNNEIARDALAITDDDGAGRSTFKRSVSLAYRRCPHPPPPPGPSNRAGGVVLCLQILTGWLLSDVTRLVSVCEPARWGRRGPVSQSPSRWAHDVVATLNQRRWRWFNVARTSCVQWDVHRSPRHADTVCCVKSIWITEIYPKQYLASKLL